VCALLTERLLLDTTAVLCCAVANTALQQHQHMFIGNGGALYTSGILGVFSSRVTNNTAILNGGAVYSDYGAFAGLKDSVISGNTAEQSGALLHL
jgi:predicted outer membrane repeat protein